MRSKPTKSIHIRKSERYAPVFARVEEIAAKRAHHQVTPVLMEILELGLQSYDNGLRMVENQVVDIKDTKSKMN